MNILISINKQYLFHAQMMLFSLFKQDRKSMTVYLLYVNLDKSDIEALDKFLCEKCNSHLLAICIENNIFNGAMVNEHFSIEMYFRILAFDLLPNDVERVLWLDSDIIIKESIEVFYNQNFEGMDLVVCQNIGSEVSINLERLGLNNAEDYFNSGVILFDLNAVRKRLTVKNVKECLDKYGHILRYPDQDLLNILFLDHIKYADYKLYNYQLNPRMVLSEDEKSYLDENTCIIHYVSGFKPWKYQYSGYAEKYYWNCVRECKFCRRYYIHRILQQVYRLYKKFKS